MRALTLLFAATLTACAAQGDPYARSATGRTAVPTFATQLAAPSTYLAPMPTAVILLKPGDLNRNRAFCSAVTQLPTAQNVLARSTTAPNLVLTRWLVQLADVPPDRVADCDFLVGTYDYARARQLLARTRLTDGAVAGQGPFLLMIIPDQTGFRIAGLDGSALPETSFPAFVATWATALDRTQSTLTRPDEEPGVVRSAFNLVSAILRTVAGGLGGLLRGALSSV